MIPDQGFCDAVFRDHTGNPINTTRWEGFRDGVDDYLYIRLIRQGIGALPESAPLRREAAELIANPLSHFPQVPRNGDDLATFRDYRRQLARMIVRPGAGAPESAARP